jgi:hypothetical protein
MHVLYRLAHAAAAASIPSPDAAFTNGVPASLRSRRPEGHMGVLQGIQKEVFRLPHQHINAKSTMERICQFIGSGWTKKQCTLTKLGR